MELTAVLVSCDPSIWLASPLFQVPPLFIQSLLVSFLCIHLSSELFLKQSLLYEVLNLLILEFVSSQRDIDQIIQVSILDHLNDCPGVDLVWEVRA